MSANGQPPKRIVLTMSPADRKLWIAAHGRGELEGYNLVHDAELAALSNQMRQALALEVDCKTASRALGKFWERNPSLEEAARDAVHEARQMELGLDRALKALAYAKTELERLSVAAAEPVDRIDAINQAGVLANHIAEIRKIAGERFDRTKKEDGA